MILLTIAYDGTNYHGWQWQDNARSVQQVVEAAIEKVTGPHPPGERSRLLAAGRTDAGVHAVGQLATFRTDTRLDEPTLKRALNANLPVDVRVRKVQTVADDFQLLKRITHKRYEYRLADGPEINLFERAYVWHVGNRLDVAAMQVVSGMLVGRHDFAAFQTSGSERENTVRTILDLSVESQGSMDDDYRRLIVSITADGFLYNMARNIVGSLVEVGRGGRPVTWIAEVLAGRDRKLAGPTAPPHGLCMMEVWYA